MKDQCDKQFSNRQKKLILLSMIGLTALGFSFGTIYERSILIPSDQQLKPLTIMQYYPSPDLLVKALNDNQITCKNLPLEIQRMVNTFQEGICKT